MPDTWAEERVAVATNVSRETLARLDTILAVLDDWRGRLNLIGPREWAHVWSRHVADSLQLAAILGEARDIVDLGSGAGFPGLVLAASMPPPVHVTLVESVAKKCAFLRTAIEAAQLPANVLWARAETLSPRPADAVTARAVAPLPRLLDLAAPWLESGAIGVFPKGENWRGELTAAQERWTFACEAIPSRTGGSGAILKLSEVRRV